MEIIEIGSQSCGQCKMLTRNLNIFSSKHPEVKITNIVLEETDDDIITQYNIKSIPMMILKVKDKKDRVFTGLYSVEKLEEIYNKNSKS